MSCIIKQKYCILKLDALAPIVNLAQAYQGTPSGSCFQKNEICFTFFSISLEFTENQKGVTPIYRLFSV